MPRITGTVVRSRLLRPRRNETRPTAIAFAIAAILFAACLVGSGCATGTGEGRSGVPRGTTPDGLAKVSTRGPGTLYVKPDHPVGSYDDIMVASIGISYAPGQKELSDEDEDVIFERMVAALEAGTAAGFGLAKQPGPCTVKMGIYLTDVDFYESKASGSQTRFVSSYGAATLVFEFKDSLTDEALIRYGQRRSFGSGVDSGNVRGANLDRLGKTLDRMLEDVGNTLQDVLAGQVDARSERGCSGNLGRALSERG